MAQPLLTNTAIEMPQEQPLGTTPAPLPAASVQPGSGLPPGSKAAIDSNIGRGPMPGDAPTPMPKPSGGSSVMPKPPVLATGGPSVPGEPLIGGATGLPSGSPGGPNATPMPKPAGPGTAPRAPAVTPISATSGSIDWRSAISQSDRGAVTRRVSEDELTSKQLSRLIDENGRFIQSARLGAREGAASGGMLLSTIAQGNAERAAIDAAMPIAQSDANVYATTASENMRARNEDALADQGAGRSLISQSEAQRFQGAESAAGRQFQRDESATERNWRTMEAGKDRDLQFLMQERGFSFQDAQAAIERGWRSTEADLDRAQQRNLQTDQQNFQRTEAGTERDWRSREAVAERDFTGSQNEQQRLQQRISEYNALMMERERGFQNQLAAIFSNTNLKPEEQARAVENARAVFSSTAASFNAAFASGIPSIFMRPYEMQRPAPGTQPSGSTPNGQLIGGGTGIGGDVPIPGTTLVRGADGIIRQVANAITGR